MVLRSAQWYPEEAWLAKDKTVPETFPLLSDHRVVCWGRGVPGCNLLWYLLFIYIYKFINLADVGREALGEGHSAENVLVLRGPSLCFLPQLSPV